MKNHKKLFFLIFVLFIIFSFNAFAQKGKSKAKGNKAEEEKPLTKKELKALTKEWKKKKNRQKPLDYKKMIDDYETKISELTEGQKTIKAKSDQLQKKEVELTLANEDLKKQVDELTGVVASLQNKPPDTTQNSVQVSQPKEPPPVKKGIENGIIFKVQIGAFKSFDIRDYLWNNDALSSTNDADLTKYTLGQFRDFETSKAFETDIRRMGLKDAFTVAFRDGKKINVEEARKLAPAPAKGENKSTSSEKKIKDNLSTTNTGKNKIKPTTGTAKTSPQKPTRKK
ncbi:MAG: hypothetical protein A3H98_14540 [Bacteroidetes bacterium RIFCSPLOWO2_02_FULL_36_8]|nr:MAG: hypothetical protein A3H98_14540 [Bacteroidetes bacterium RIFCSPLOWO2_02_FULL_36_8]OFY72146.1 MAG: hypothetical protein A3G23_07230 [Bacteroidetes bacterium RIFCSPLOWO2_12_FULL_37_12]